MNINQNSNCKFNFKSGLSRKILAKSLIFDAKNTEIFLNNKNIDAKFLNNKAGAFCFFESLKIFDILKDRLGLKFFDYKIPRIRIYNDKELCVNANSIGFCIPETRKVLKNEPAFETASIFQKNIDSLEKIDSIIDGGYKKNNRSSGHFLAETIHEILHAVYINAIYKKYGYNGLCPYTKSTYYKQNSINRGLDVMQVLETLALNDSENKVVKNVLGNYAAQTKNQYHEIFAETFTKLICNTLSKNLIPNTNPLEELKKYPKEFINILKKIVSI